MALKRGLKGGKQREEEKSVSPSDDKTQDSSSAPTETATVTSAAIVATTKERKTMADNEPTSLMEFSSDLSTAEAPPPLPVGEYPASIVKAEIKDSAKGNKYLALMFRIEPESYPADFIDGNPEGETLSYNRVVLQDNPQGRYRMRKFLESVGGTLSTRVDPNELMGLTATVGIVHGKWEGETRAEIAKVLAA
jgi:uncharacterized protein DUF669